MLNFVIENVEVDLVGLLMAMLQWKMLKSSCVLYCYHLIVDQAREVRDMRCDA